MTTKAKKVKTPEVVIPDIVEAYDKDHQYVVVGSSAYAGVIGPNLNRRKWYRTKELAEADAFEICKRLNMDGRELELLVLKPVSRVHSTPPNDAEIEEIA